MKGLAAAGRAKSSGARLAGSPVGAERGRGVLLTHPENFEINWNLLPIPSICSYSPLNPQFYYFIFSEF